MKVALRAWPHNYNSQVPSLELTLDTVAACQGDAAVSLRAQSCGEGGSDSVGQEDTIRRAATCLMIIDRKRGGRTPSDQFVELNYSKNLSRTTVWGNGGITPLMSSRSTQTDTTCRPLQDMVGPLVDFDASRGHLNTLLELWHRTDTGEFVSQ